MLAPPIRLFTWPSGGREPGLMDNVFPVHKAPPIFERSSTSHAAQLRHIIPEKPCPAITRTVRLPRLTEYGKRWENIW